MSNIRVKHLKGWMSAEKMQNPEWIEHWIKEASKAESENKQLVVFEIPKEQGNYIIELLEKTLQDLLD